MKLFLLLIRSSWLTGLLSVLLGAASGLASLSLITLIHRALSGPQVQTQLGPLFAVACLAVMVTQIAAKRILVKLSQSTAARLQYKLCLKILSAPLDNLEKVGPNRLLNTIGSDVAALTGALTHFPSVCANLMVLICGISYLAYLSVPLACWTLGMAMLGVITYLAGIRWANVHLRQAREDSDEVAKQLHAMVFGIKELKANNARNVDFLYGCLLPADTIMRKRVMKGVNILDGTNTWGRLFLFVGIGMLVFLWPRFWPVSTTTLTGYTLTILYLTNPLEAILGWLPALNSASISLNKIREFGLLFDDSGEAPIRMMPPRFESLELSSITHRYDSPNEDESGFTLGPVDLQLSRGEVLFIAGGNGSGKTTLAKVLTGLYAPQEGHVCLNGIEVNERSRGNYRQLFATVFVEGHLFDRLLGIEASSIQLQHWLVLLGIEEKVDVETGRLRLDSLSRGQHKRLALLVACLDDRPVFVFDEWAAEQDPTFKNVFYREILPELKRRGRTVVAITHDDRYFSEADHVVKLTDGRLESISKRQAA